MKVELERPSLALIGPAAEVEPPTSGPDFAAGLAQALSKIEDVTADADTTSEGLVTGEVDIHEAMVAMEKADLVLKLGTTVRNKLLDAYRQLSQVGSG